MTSKNLYVLGAAGSSPLIWESYHSEVIIAFQNHSYPPVPS